MLVQALRGLSAATRGHMTPPPSSTPRPGSRPLSTPALLLAGTALFAVYLVLLRFAYGSWARGAAASVAPAIFGFGLLVLWLIERRRGRALLPRSGTILLLAVLGALAGAAASLVVSTTGPAWAGAVTGLFFGTLMGVAWARHPRPVELVPADQRPEG